jgi:hypothetical protein
VTDMMHNGRRLRLQALVLPSGGFSAKLTFWPDSSRDTWTWIVTLPGPWDTADEAEQAALARGQRMVDAEGE